MLAGTCKEMAVGTVHRSCKRFRGLTRIQFATHERLHNRYRPRRARLALAAVAGVLLASGPVMPAHALSVAGGGVCTGGMTLTFTPPLTSSPAAPVFGVSAAIPCTGVGGSSLTVSGTVSSLDATCAAIAGIGSGAMSFGVASAQAATIVMAAVGPAQVWIGFDVGAVLVASGAFTWTNTTEIGNCLGSGTSTVTLWGSFVVAA